MMIWKNMQISKSAIITSRRFSSEYSFSPDFVKKREHFDTIKMRKVKFMNKSHQFMQSKNTAKDTPLTFDLKVSNYTIQKCKLLCHSGNYVTYLKSPIVSLHAATSHSCMHAIFNRNWVTFIPHVWCATVNNILSIQRRTPHWRNHHKNWNKTKEIIIIILKQQQKQQQRRSNVDWRENLWNKASNGVELNRKLIAV